MQIGRVALLLGLVIGLALRIYPFIMFGEPYSTDGWPIIGNAEILSLKTPINLGSEVFDGYNNYWPTSMIYGLVISETTGLPLRMAFGLFIPIAGWAGLVAFYILVKKFLGVNAASIAVLILAVVPFYAIFMAGVTKEGYATSLYILLIHQILTGANIPTLVLLSLGLAMSHHLTLAITLAVTLAIAVELAYRSFTGSSKTSWNAFKIPAAMAAVAIPYYAIYARHGFKYTIDAADLLSLTSYVILTTIAMLRLSDGKRKGLALSIAGSTLVIMTVYLFTFKAPTPGLMPGGLSLITYGLPILLMIPPALYALPQYGGRGLSMWLAAPLGVELFALVSSSPISSILLIRAPNFIYPPLAALASWTLLRVKRFRNLFTIIIVALIVAGGIQTVNIAYNVGDRLLSYSWRYTRGEWLGALWIAKHNDGCNVLGDLKMSYLFKGYFGLATDVTNGLKLLTGRGCPRGVLVVYPDMLRFGYLIGLYPVWPGDNWADKLSSLNIVYSGVIKAYWRG